MGMDVVIGGLKPAGDPKFEKYLKVHETCLEARIQVPEKVREYFNYKNPTKDGVEVNIDEAISVYEYSKRESPGWKINLTKLPTDMKYVVVWVSY